MSGRDNSSQWSSPLSHHSDSSLLTDLHHSHNHSILLQSQNESGFCDNDSDITASSHNRSKQVHSPNSNSQYTTYSSDISTAPPVLGPMQRSVSNEITPVHEQEGPVLAALTKKTPQFHRKLPGTNRMATSLSQDTYTSDYRQPFLQHHPGSLSLSQSSHLPRYPPRHYFHKPGSPASSSDTSSRASSIPHRIGSGPGSIISFSTESSSRSNPTNKGLLPRPSSLSSSSATTISKLNHTHYTDLYAQGSSQSRSEYGLPAFIPSLPTQYDYDSEKSHPVIKPSPKLSQDSKMASRQQNIPLREIEYYMHGKRDGDKIPFDQPRNTEEGSHRDSFSKMVLSAVLSDKDKTDADVVSMLLPLSKSPEPCSLMRQTACMGMLIQIMHNIDRKADKSHREVRTKASDTLRNIVESTEGTRKGKYEMCVLGVLEKIRGHCEALFEFIHSFPNTRKVDESERESLQNACDFLLQPIKKLYKYSNEKDHYRPVVLTLGGLQATAELLVVNFRLMTSQKDSTSKPVCHSMKTIAVTISILVNLTYGDMHNKSTLCMFPDLLKALMHHLRLQNEAVVTSGAQLLRNLSWKATSDIKDSLLKSDASLVLMDAIQHMKDEQAVQHITSALWNLSAHSLENREKICTTDTGLKLLVELLSYNSPSGTTTVVENVGGILKNLSVVIMQREEYRKKFRQSGGLGKLVQHLKSKNKTVLSNATGTLWNLSARYPEDQKVLWDLGCVPLLDVLQTAHHKNIAEYARGALRNLLAFGRTNGWTSKSDVTAYNIKTQKELSKSLCYAANQVFSHSPTQGKHESPHSRRNLPMKHDQDRQSASGMRDSARTLVRGCDIPDGSTSSGDEEYIHMENSLKFGRVASVPETRLNQKGDEHEWSSYMPGHGPHASSGKLNLEGFATDMSAGGRRKVPPQVLDHLRDMAVPRSLSQSESYHLSAASNSEAHPGNAAHFLPSQLSNEPREGTSLLTCSDHELDTKFDAAHSASVTRFEEYSDLEVDEDEMDDIDQPIHEQMKRENEEFKRLQAQRPGQKLLGRQSPSRLGTSSLALDGLRHKEDGEKKVTNV